MTFKPGQQVAVKSNRGKEIYGPRTIHASPPDYEGAREKVRIFCNGKDTSAGWITYDAETGRGGGIPGATLQHWTPEVEAQVRHYEKQSDVANLISDARETQWCRNLTEEECDQLVAILRPVRERD